jgi:nucleotide-binding universal stress UspA family protein
MGRSPDSKEIQMETIVVGVDESPCSLDAVRWALEEARLRHARLRAVHAWRQPAPVTPAAARPPVGLDLDAYRQEAERRLGSALGKAAGDAQDVEIERVVAEGSATEALVDAARDASLLVLGARGLGTFAGLILGHVSHQCTLLAPCPVVVVPAPRPAEGRTDEKRAGQRREPARV